MSKSLIKPTKNEVSQKPKTRCGNPYKTCRKWILFESKSQKWHRKWLKSITFIDKSYMTFRHVEKHYETNGNDVFQKAKSVAKTLIKPVENEDFWAKIAKRLPKWLKSITFTDKTHMAFRHVENPYKTCRKWRFFGVPKREKSELPHFRYLEKSRYRNSAFPLFGEIPL